MIDDGRPQILILRALGLGDLLTAVPALRAISLRFREHRRILLAPAWLRPLLPLIRAADRPCVDQVLPVDGLDVDARRLPREPELALNLHGRGPQSHRLIEATDPQETIAFGCDGFRGAGLRSQWAADEHEVSRWCRLLEENGVPADPDALHIDTPIAKPPRWARGATLIHPGAASPARRWPAERWAAVARFERRQGHEVVITGTEAELELTRRVGRLAGVHASRVLAGRTSVLGLAALVAAARVVACGDTGVAHLATALGTPSVLLFGPTPPRLWGPLIDRDIHRVFWSGRGGDPHGESVDPGLLEIEVDPVAQAVSEPRLVAVQ